MATIINKSDLTYLDGMLVHGDKVVTISKAIVSQANRLETLAQKVEYLKAQPDYSPMPSLDGFKRRSEDDDLPLDFDVPTTLLDRKAQEAMLLMQELDDQTTCRQATAMLGDFKALMEFAIKDYVIDDDSEFIHKFDMPTIGNPLELKPETIARIVASVHGMDVDTETDDEEE